MRFCVLGSGSKGNATFVETGDHALLIDCGFSGREVQRRCREAGLDLGRVRGIVVTHEHADHVRGVGILARRLQVPIYGNDATLAAAAGAMGRVPRLEVFTTGRSFTAGGLSLHPFSVSHDAADPVGLLLQGPDGSRLGYCTDTGVVSRLLRHRLAGCHGLVLECNHDPALLANGPYPLPLQQRVRSASGHLANHDAITFLVDLLHDRLQHVVLAHISEANNHPGVIETVLDQLLPAGPRPRIHLARQDRPGPVVELRSG